MRLTRRGLIGTAASLPLLPTRHARAQAGQSLRIGILTDLSGPYQDLAGHSLWSVITAVHTGGENSPPLFFVLSWLTSKLGDPTVWLRYYATELERQTWADDFPEPLPPG